MKKILFLLILISSFAMAQTKGWDGDDFYVPGELEMTGTGVEVDLNPAGTGSSTIIDITPTAVITTNESEWKGINIDGAALDPSGDDVTVIGVEIDLTGTVYTGDNAYMEGLELKMPFGYNAIDVEEGTFHLNTVLPNVAGSLFTGFDAIADVTAQNAASEYHAIDVGVAGGIPAGGVTALGTGNYVKPIHQHIGTPGTPSQTEYAGEKTTGGTVWVDGIDGSEIFVVKSDEVYLGHTAQFSAIEVIMGTPGTKSVVPTFWYNTAADTWTQFYPNDETNGFQNSGSIRWNLATITGLWTANGDPGGAEASTGYWIKIIRAGNPDPGTPTPTTMKYEIDSTYEWDENGDLAVRYLGDETVQSSDAEFSFISVAAAAGSNSHHASFDGATSGGAREMDIYLDTDAGTDTYRLVFALNSGAEGMTMDETGNLALAGVFKMTERAGQVATVATEGEFWVKNDAPTAPMFTDDDGDDHDILTSPDNTKDLLTIDRLHIDSTPDTDETASGIVVELTAGEVLNVGDIGYQNADGEIYLADATDATKMPGMFMCIETAADGVASDFLMTGVVRDDTWNWTVGGLIYATITGTTGNTLSQTAPIAAGEQVQVIGVATNADRMTFTPSLVLVTI